MASGYQHLLGIPWAEAHCGELAWRFLVEALGWPVPAEACYLAPAPAPGGADPERLAAFLAQPSWRQVGTAVAAAEEPGDWILWEQAEYVPHVGVLAEPGWVLSTWRDGRSLLLPLGRLRGALGVWRWIGPRGDVRAVRPAALGTAQPRGPSGAPGRRAPARAGGEGGVRTGKTGSRQGGRAGGVR